MNKYLNKRKITFQGIKCTTYYEKYTINLH